MRVLFLTDGLGGGGAERQLAGLLANMHSDFTKSLYSIDAGIFSDSIREMVDSLILSSTRVRGFTPSLICEIFQCIRRFRPDVVCSWGGWKASLAAGISAKILSIPNMNCTIRSANINIKRAVLKRLTFLFSDLVVANSKAGLLAWKPRRGQVIYNGFEVNRLISSVSKNKRAGIQIIMTGRVAPQKDFNSFLRAAEILASTHVIRRYSITFKVVGDGPQLTSYKKQFYDLVNQGVVSFSGQLFDPMEEVCRSHIGVLMTSGKHHAEGCSNSIMEYMAASLPVICSDSGGSTELISDEVNGFVVDDGDYITLSERIHQLCQDDVLRSRLGDSGYNELIKNFSMQSMVSQYEHCFRQLAGSEG